MATVEPPVGRPRGRFRRCLDWCRRNPALCALALMVVLQTVVAQVVVAFMWLRMEWKERRIIELERQVEEFRKGRDAGKPAAK